MNQINAIKSLSDCATGERVVIIDVDAGSGALRNLSNLGLRIGNEIVIARRTRLGGPVLVRSTEVEIAIGRRLAKKILVQAV